MKAFYDRRINTALLETSLDTYRPEAPVYRPAENGELKLSAVEYIVLGGIGPPPG